VKPSDLAMITRVMGPVVREFTAKAVTEAVAAVNEQHAERYAAFELRILELETRPPVEGPAGLPGQKGETGSGIASLMVSAEGRLVAHLTDGRSLDAGPVPKGEDGAQGMSIMGPQGEPGKDAPEPDMDAIVTRVLALVPQPERGEKGERGEPGLHGKDGDTGLQGDPGKDATPPDVDAIVTRVLALVPPPVKGEKGEPGQDGRAGKDVDMKLLHEFIRGLVTKSFDALPRVTDGRNGENGTSVTVEDVAPLIVREIEQRISAIPVAKDGLGFTGAVVNQEGHLVLTLSNGEQQNVGPVVGKSGSPGRDGKDAIGTPGIDGVDGLGFDDIQVAHDGERSFEIKFVRGDRVKSCGTFTIPAQIDRGVYQAGKTYERGDGATWDGHFWIAQTKTHEPPGEGSSAWRLAVRRGKQGREGKQGPSGKDGRDLTSIDPATGRKW
jgi:integrin beta 3